MPYPTEPCEVVVRRGGEVIFRAPLPEGQPANGEIRLLVPQAR